MQIANYAIALVVGISMGVGAVEVSSVQKENGKSSDLLQGDKLTAPELKKMAEGLGYDVKDLNSEPGKEKYEVPTKTDKLNIPVSLEVSPSGNYVWLTVNLGNNAPTKKHEEMLKSNANTQPTFMYITAKGNVMAAHPIDSRQISPAILKRCLDKIVADVDKTTSIWQN